MVQSWHKPPPPPNPHRAAMAPSRVEFNVGKTVHGQPLRLVGELQNNGTRTWELHRDQANQRDDKDIVRGLTADVIERMAEAVRGVQP